MADSFTFPPPAMSRYRSLGHTRAGSSVPSSPAPTRDTSSSGVSRGRSHSQPRHQADQKTPFRVGKMSLDLPHHPFGRDSWAEDWSDEGMHPGYTILHDTPPPHPRPEPASSLSTSSHYSTSEHPRLGDTSSPLANAKSESSKARILASLFKRKGSNIAPQPCNGAANPSSTKTRTLRRIHPAGEARNGGGGQEQARLIVQPIERTVIVEHGKSKLKVPVSSSMTALDIVQHASKHWPSRINSDSAVLLEYFISVGIQRPLRQFERMQDVMNSWTHDRQNYLILIDPGTGSAEAELTLAGNPSQLPRKQSWVLEYSQKVGKWDKRIVTLHPSGLITQAARNSNVDAARTKEIGYLSDCDIYVPTPAKVRGKIKPPRRFCFAVKSQQDMSCFGSLCDYVHFFCTHDRQTADTFYAAVQGWRSRHLVGGLREDVKGKRGDDVPREKEMPSKAKGVVVSTTQAPFTKSAGQFDTSLSPERRNGAMNFALSLNGGGGSRLRRLDLERADPRGGKVGRGVAM